MKKLSFFPLLSLLMVFSGFEQKLVLQRKKMGHRKYKSLSSTNKHIAGLEKKKISLNPSEHIVSKVVLSAPLTDVKSMSQ